MEELQRQIGRARRRLTLQRFAIALGWCLAIALAAALVMVGVDKFHPLGLNPWLWPAAAALLGLLAAAIWSLVTGRGSLDAAIELDRRFALKERVSTAWALDPTLRDTPSGQAVLAAAVEHVKRIEVGSRFAVRPGRQLFLPLLPLAALVLVALLLHPRAAESTTAAAAVQQVEQVRNSIEPLKKQLADQREQARKEGLRDAEELLKKLEAGAKDLAAGKLERKEALIKLKNLNDLLQQRRDQLGNSEALRQMLRQLKEVPQGPAEQFAKAVGKGDFQKALAELDKLQQALKEGKLSEQQKQDLAHQMEQMKDRLNELVKNQQDAQRALAEQIKKLQQAGQQAQADKRQQQLNKLAEKMPQLGPMQDLAKQLGQCSKCLRNGKLQDAQAALAASKGQMQDLQKQLDELKMLDEAQNQLAQAGDKMGCKQCNGAGCAACQGNALDADFFQPAPGLGRGRAMGERPEPKTDTRTYDSQTMQKVGPGASTAVDMVHGPNVKGTVLQEIQSQTAAVRQGSTDPLVEQKMSREQREHAREYFDRFRKGE